MQRTLRISSALLSFVAFSLATACGASDLVSPEASTTSFTAVSSTQLAGTVGTATSVDLAVKAADASGKPVSGLLVAFAVTGGGTLGKTSATTDATGTASAGAWTLGNTSGTQTVVATAGTRTVTFTAIAAAGAAASVTAVAGATSTALTGSAVTALPSVQVKDAFGNSVSGASVNFAVTAGGGTLASATATTNATGIATLGGWTLGVEPGAQTVRATVGTLSTTFTSTATLPTGCAVAPYAVGATINGTWATGDCVNATPFANAGPFDQYELSLTSQQNIRVELTGEASRTVRIRRKGTTDDYVGLPLGSTFVTVTGTTISQRHLLGAGTYIIEVQTPAGNSGAYTLRSVADNGDIVCRPIVQGSMGITFDGKLDATTDCPSPVAAGTVEDWIVLPLKTGDKFRITMSSTTMPIGFVLRDDRLGPASPTLAARTSATPGTITLDWTATFDTYHEIVMFKTAGASVPYGAYTIKIERLP